jgi:hypothetical protein
MFKETVCYEYVLCAGRFDYKNKQNLDLIIPQAKRANELSERSEWNGRKFTHKKIITRPYTYG